MVVYLESKGELKSEVMDVFFGVLFEGCGKGFYKEIVKKKMYLDVVV